MNKKALLGILGIFILMLFFPNSLWSQDLDKLTVGSTYHVVLKDGSELHGELVQKSADQIVIKTAAMGEITIAAGDIEKIDETTAADYKGGKYRFPNPSYSKYLWGQTGRNLKKGDGYYQNVLIVFNSAHYGITNWFSIGAGFEGISTFMGEPIFFVMPKFGYEFFKNFSAGISYLYGNAAVAIEEGGFSGIGVIYGTVTYGNMDYNGTVGFGWAHAEGSMTNDPLITVSGMARVARRLAIVTENYLIPADPYYAIFSYGLRILGERSAFDISFLNSKDIAEVFPVGLPVWISYSFHF